jgi:hypothetical protein
MQEQTSKELIDDLYKHEKHLRDLTRMFAEHAGHESLQLPLCCFYERETTKILRGVLPTGLANALSKGVPGSSKIV